ncbi:hypothetical protein C1H46_033353 [Malus baccata]|uniref:Rx N-terminal domain-containing protein n=1 Tax=Malus baccata TaxID=106549 RepID=A0A540L4A6_MALBA|nr:hypothetical protein C1H46_033353 [Malus baccata]
MLTEIVAEIEGLSGGPRGVIREGGVAGGVEEPAGGSAHGVIDVLGCRRCGGGGSGGSDGDEKHNGRRISGFHGSGWALRSEEMNLFCISQGAQNAAESGTRKHAKLSMVLFLPEAKLARDSRSEVGFIRDEIESIRSFLKDADAKAATKDDEMANDRFVKLKKGKTLEEVGEEYLTELIHRNLVQVSKVYIDGKARSCRVHDLLHEVLRRKGADSSFCHMLSEDESTFELVTRHLLIDSSPSEALGSITQSHIRSVFTFNQAEWPVSFLNTLSGNLKLVKVLDFTDAPLNYLPKFSLVYEIPAEIKRLVKLRHLLGYYHDYNIEFSLKSERGVKIDDGIGCLQALQKLYHVEANHGGINLQSTPKAKAAEKVGPKKLENPPEFIRIVYLKGRLEKLPSWIPKLQLLVKLKIFWSRLRDSPLKALQNLPYRLELGLLYKAYDGVELHFERGFQKLEVLQLRDLDGLNSLVIDNGAMPLLRELQIGPSPQLKEMPSSIHHLRNLTTLRFVNMLKEFQCDVDPKNGQHYWIVKHIRDVLFSYKFGTRCGIYETHNLRVSPN